MAKQPLRLATDDAPRDPMKFRFTKRALAAIKPGERRQWFYDTEAAHLAFSVTPSGGTSFYFAGRIDGRFRRCKLRGGDFPDMTVEQARKAITRDWNGPIASGENPADARVKTRTANSFGDFFAHYIETYAKQHKRSWAEDQRQFDCHLSKWASRRLDGITRSDVQALHAGIGKESPVAANRLVALLSKVYNVAIDGGFEGANPAHGIKRFKESTRARFIEADELGRFMLAASREAKADFADYLRLLVYTAQRRRNVASMEWDELDMRRAVWVIPASKFKTGEETTVPLAPQAAGILESRQGDKAGLYVFPSKRADAKCPHLADPRAAFNRACKAAGITNLTMHDLRRSVATLATSQGTPYPIVQAMLGHAAEGTTAIYARPETEAVRQAFTRLADAIDEQAAKAEQEEADKQTD